MISVTEQAGAIPGLTYRAGPTYANGRNWALYYRVAASYITGCARVQGRIQQRQRRRPDSTYNFQPVSYRFRDGVPNQFTLYATPYSITTESRPRPRRLRRRIAGRTTG